MGVHLGLYVNDNNDSASNDIAAHLRLSLYYVSYKLKRYLRLATRALNLLQTTSTSRNNDSRCTANRLSYVL